MKIKFYDTNLSWRLDVVQGNRMYTAHWWYDRMMRARSWLPLEFCSFKLNKGKYGPLPPSGLIFKNVMRWDSQQKKFRLFRFGWNKGEVGAGGYSTKISAAIRPQLFSFWKDFREWQLTLFGVSVHKKVSYGGRFV